MGVSKNNGIPKSSIFIGFSIIFTIHFGGFSPYFWKHPIFLLHPSLHYFKLKQPTTQHGGRQFPGKKSKLSRRGATTQSGEARQGEEGDAQSFQKGGMTFERFSKNRGKTPKWMVYIYIMENTIKMDDLGVPLFSETSIWLMVQKSGKLTSSYGSWNLPLFAGFPIHPKCG